MGKLCGMIASGLLGLLGALHVYWACMGSWGSNAVLPTQDGRRLLNPTKGTTWAVALALFGAMATVLGRVILSGQRRHGWLFRWGTRSIGLIFFLRAVGDFRMMGFFKTIIGTRFAAMDTWLLSPVCVLIAALCAATEHGD